MAAAAPCRRRGRGRGGRRGPPGRGAVRGSRGRPAASAHRAPGSCRGLAPPSRADRGVGRQPGPCLHPRRPRLEPGHGAPRAAGVGGGGVGGGRSEVCRSVPRSVRP